MPNVVLTFDDGPGPDTERLLDTLGAHGVEATFFLVGQHVEQFPRTVERMAREGHVLGNHTYSHPWDIPSPSFFAEEIRRTDALIYDAMGIVADAPNKPFIPFRLPGGPRAGDPRLAVATGMNRPHVHWTGEFADWAPRSAEEIYGDVKDHVDRYAALGLDVVLLLHDWALEKETFRDRSASVAAVELLLARGVLRTREASVRR